MRLVVPRALLFAASILVAIPGGAQSESAYQEDQVVLASPAVDDIYALVHEVYGMHDSGAELTDHGPSAVVEISSADAVMDGSGASRSSLTLSMAMGPWVESDGYWTSSDYETHMIDVATGAVFASSFGNGSGGRVVYQDDRPPSGYPCAVVFLVSGIVAPDATPDRLVADSCIIGPYSVELGGTWSQETDGDPEETVLTLDSTDGARLSARFQAASPFPPIMTYSKGDLFVVEYLLEHSRGSVAVDERLASAQAPNAPRPVVGTFGELGPTSGSPSPPLPLFRAQRMLENDSAVTSYMDRTSGEVVTSLSYKEIENDLSTVYMWRFIWSDPTGEGFAADVTMEISTLLPGESYAVHVADASDDYRRFVLALGQENLPSTSLTMGSVIQRAAHFLDVDESRINYIDWDTQVLERQSVTNVPRGDVYSFHDWHVLVGVKERHETGHMNTSTVVLSGESGDVTSASQRTERFAATVQVFEPRYAHDVHDGEGSRMVMTAAAGGVALMSIGILLLRRKG